MTIEEPQLLGAVVETEDGRVWMRYPDPEDPDWFRWVGRYEDSGTLDAWVWEYVAYLNPVVRYEGFPPRPKEPTLPCAVVRDKDGDLWVRLSKHSGMPWHCHAVVSWANWSRIVDPEVIFEGVPE